MRDEGIVGDPSTWPVAKTSGEMVRVEVRPGVFLKMHVDEARARGLLKEQPPARDKQRRPSRNK